DARHGQAELFCSVLLQHTRQTPSDEKHRHADAEQPRIRTHRTCSDDIDEQDPHADELSETPEIIESGRQLFFRLCALPPVARGTILDRHFPKSTPFDRPKSARNFSLSLYASNGASPAGRAGKSWSTPWRGARRGC